MAVNFEVGEVEDLWSHYPPCVWEIRTVIPFYVSFDVSLSNSQASHALSYKRNVVRTYTRSVFLHVSGIKKNFSDIRTRHLRGVFFFGYFDLMQERQSELPRSRASKKARISVWEIFFWQCISQLHGTFKTVSAAANKKTFTKILSGISPALRVSLVFIPFPRKGFSPTIYILHPLEYSFI